MKLTKSLDAKGAVLTIALIVAGVLVVGGAGAYFATNGFDRQNSQTTSENTETQAESEPHSADSSIGLLKNALAGGDAVRCTFRQNDYPGTAYITSEANFRVDARSEEGQAHIVKQGDSAYLWMDGQNEGFVFSGKAYDEEFEDNFDTFNPEAVEENVDQSDTQDLDCERADVDPSLFELPDNVNFRSMEELMQSVPNQ